MLFFDNRMMDIESSDRRYQLNRFRFRIGNLLDLVIEKDDSLLRIANLEIHRGMQRTFYII